MSDEHDENEGTATATEAAGDAEARDPERDADAELRRRMAVAQVRQWGDPVLRLRAHDVTSFDDDLRRFTDRMVELMHDARGIGLAATQVGVLRRIFVFQADEDDEPVAVVNPVVTVTGSEKESDEEGCLSLQGVLVPVERPTQVRLDGLDVTGAPLSMELEGLGARVVQHELDHLDGVLILDRTDRESRREALKALRPKPSLD